MMWNQVKYQSLTADDALSIVEAFMEVKHLVIILIYI